MENPTDCNGICEKFTGMPSGALSVHWRKSTSIPKYIPVSKRNCLLITLRSYRDIYYRKQRGESGVDRPGNSNSRILLPLLKSCSSSLTSRNLEQYFWCSLSSWKCSSEQWVGHPQSGHSNFTARGCVEWFKELWLWNEAQTGHAAKSWIASPRARRAGKGDLENGWKRLSWARIGSGCGCGFCLRKKLNRFLVWAAGTTRRARTAATNGGGKRIRNSIWPLVWGCARNRRARCWRKKITFAYHVYKTSFHFSQNEWDSGRCFHWLGLRSRFSCPTDNQHFHWDWFPRSCM
jgi:hypothetical protein